MSTTYEHGRRARSQGCYRALVVATDSERAEWIRGYDDMDAELTQRQSSAPRTAVTITWADDAGHDFTNRGSYLEYEVVIEATVREGYRPTFNRPGENASVESFRVVEIVEAVAYPLASKQGVELNLAELDRAAIELLTKEVNRAMHRDNERSEKLILEAAVREQAAV